MTPAEQVACDALRSAGLDELADNLAFAREAVRMRERIAYTNPHVRLRFEPIPVDRYGKATE